MLRTVELHQTLAVEMSLEQHPISVARPALPTVDNLIPYLRLIDSARYYSNFGPLVTRFEERLAAQLGDGTAAVVTVANGTLGLTLALWAQGATAGSLCMMPSWTFAASAHAARAAGLIPYFVDVNAEDWALSPRLCGDALDLAPGPVGAVMAVSPFGSPVNGAEWEAFQERTGLPVVIDAAAGFDAVRACRVPIVVSLHATKVFGVGEGGLVLCNDRALMDLVRRLSNFGFLGAREAAVLAINAKMSEYHAAIGLAGLDVWPTTRERFMAIARQYRHSLADVADVVLPVGFGETWISATMNVRLLRSTAAAAAIALQAEGVETRRWWGDGLHRQPAFAGFGHTALPVSESLATTTLGLPCHLDLTANSIDRVTSVLRTHLCVGAPR